MKGYQSYKKYISKKFFKKIMRNRGIEVLKLKVRIKNSNQIDFRCSYKEKRHFITEIDLQFTKVNLRFVNVQKKL